MHTSYYKHIFLSNRKTKFQMYIGILNITVRPLQFCYLPGINFSHNFNEFKLYKFCFHELVTLLVASTRRHFSNNSGIVDIEQYNSIFPN